MAVIKTLKGLADEVLNYLDQAGETGTTKDVVYDVLRQVHTNRVTERKWNFMLWHQPISFSTTPGVRRYSLHQEFFRPFYFFNSTIKSTMSQVTPNSLLQNMASYPTDYDTASIAAVDWTTATGSALRFKFGGTSPLFAQPSAASVLSVTGDAAKQIIVRGDTDDGIQSELITVGTPGIIEFSTILNVTKVTEDWTQTMTLSAGSDTLLKLTAAEMGRQYKQIELLSTPTASETIQYHFYRKPSPLSYETDITDIPGEFGRILTYDALITLAGYNENLNGNMLKYWLEQRDKIEASLIDFDLGQDSINSEAEYITYIPRD